MVGKTKGEGEFVKKITAKFSNLPGTLNESTRIFWAGSESLSIGCGDIGKV